MARIKLSALVSSLNGPLNGSAIHTSKGSTFVRNKAYPKKSNSQARLSHLNSFSSIKSSWNALSSSDRSGWEKIAQTFPIFDKNGDPQILTGYAYFLRVNLKLLAFGNQPVQSPTSGLPIGVSSTLEVSELNVLQNSNGYSIDSIIFNFEATSFIPSNSIFFISIGSPQKGNNGRNWQKMHPLVSFPVQKEMVSGTSFSIAVPKPVLPISISQFPNQIYRFELAFLDLGSMKFTTISTTEAYSKSQVLAPINMSTLSFWVNPFSTTFTENANITGFGWYFEWTDPTNPFPGYELECAAGFLVDINTNPQILKPPFFGLVLTTMVTVNINKTGIGGGFREAVASQMQDYPIDFTGSSSNFRHAKAVRLFNVALKTYSQFFTFNSLLTVS